MITDQVTTIYTNQSRRCMRVCERCVAN